MPAVPQAHSRHAPSRSDPAIAALRFIQQEPGRRLDIQQHFLVIYVLRNCSPVKKAQLEPHYWITSREGEKWSIVAGEMEPMNR